MNTLKIFTLSIVWIISQSIVFGQVDSIPEKRDNKAEKIIGIALPSAMITYGLISLGDNNIRQVDYDVHNSLERHNSFWHTSIDDYAQYTPAIAAYALKFCKIESSHNLLDMTILYALSNIVAGGITQGTKSIINRERPNGNSRSFPSGHTETAFAAAEFLHQEYKDKSIWISVGGYAAATFVGVSRVYNNKHWVSDVVAGAGIGILSTKVVYWIYPHLKNAIGKKDKVIQTFIFPAYSNGNLSLALSHMF
jgi:hypothetical protein